MIPDLKEAVQFAQSGQYGAVPVSMELYADVRTPIEVLQALKAVSSHCYLLESAEDKEKWGRYTFLGYQPTAEITCTNHTVRIKKDGSIREIQGDPLEFVRELLQEYKSPVIPTLPPFTGGLVGYFSYDFIKYSEGSLNLQAKDEEGFRDMDLMLFDKVIAFDHFRQKIILIVNAKTENMEAEYRKAVQELQAMAELVQRGIKAESKPLKLLSDFRPLFDETQYCQMVERAKQYIHEGDIFQVVLSNRLEAEMEGSLMDTYRVLRTINPSPYMFYFSSGDIEIAGASPETLVKLQDGKLFTFPLAGTRPRGKNPEEDERLEQELLQDEKERAEHNMLVDLGRNDLGRISRIGTVEVEKYMSIERFSHVMHIGSTVSGQILDTKDACDAISAVLPAGTLSGAPKIRAVEIIDELENNKRGIYGGAIGYLDFKGNLDVCISIRLAFAKAGKVYVRSGAGIVADSVPKKEYEECLNKAKAVMNAIKTAEGGLLNGSTD